jgi:hypothetical protein
MWRAAQNTSNHPIVEVFINPEFQHLPPLFLAATGD